MSINTSSSLFNSNSYKPIGNLSSSVGKAINEAKGKLDAQSILKNIPFKARRKLRSQIAFAQTKEIVITPDRLVLLNLAKGGEGPTSLIMDSGTMFHLSGN